MSVRHMIALLAAMILVVPFASPAQAQLAKSSAAYDLLPAAIKASGVIKVATDAHYPTCESFAEDGKTMVGFEPDLWNAIGTVLGVKMDATSIDFSGLIPGISGGRYDMAIECITDRADREKQVTFIDFTYGTGSAIYYVKGNPKITDGDELSLCGLNTAAQVGNALTTAVDLLSDYCVKHGKPKVAMAEVPQAAAVMLGVYAGRYDFAISDAIAFDQLQKVSPKPLASFPFTLRPKTYDGMIVKTDNTQLAQALLAALKVVVQSGVYDKIWDKWRIAHAKLEDPGINLATERPLPTTVP